MKTEIGRTACDLGTICAVIYQNVESRAGEVRRIAVPDLGVVNLTAGVQTVVSKEDWASE
jgi:hypothetical protein